MPCMMPTLRWPLGPYEERRTVHVRGEYASESEDDSDLAGDRRRPASAARAVA